MSSKGEAGIGQVAASVVQYEFEIAISADRATVWGALTEQVSAWWLKDFHVLGADSIVTLDPVAGGRLVEQNGDKGLLWYTVIAVAPHEMLSLAGHCTPEWGGPCTTLLTLKLVEEGAATRLVVTDALYGKVTEGQVDSLRSGWMQMFDTGLRGFVERSA